MKSRESLLEFECIAFHSALDNLTNILKNVSKYISRKQNSEHTIFHFFFHSVQCQLLKAFKDSKYIIMVILCYLAFILHPQVNQFVPLTLKFQQTMRATEKMSFSNTVRASGSNFVKPPIIFKVVQRSPSKMTSKSWLMLLKSTRSSKSSVISQSHKS